MKVRGTASKEQRKLIEKLVNLLPPEYSKLKYTVDIYEDKERLIKERINKPDMASENYEDILNGVCGITLDQNRLVKLFHFNLYEGEPKNEKERVRLEVTKAFIFFHEIRHVWQHCNGLYQDGKSTLDPLSQEYKDDPAEKDANKFAAEMVNKHLREVKKIFKIHPDFPIEMNLKW
ncbi:hypothetical protein VE23_24805 [Paenibacillus sp. D9]|uniref:ImmA/IrrE family metallo-endopeptidase n=1 Tax=Paenibacillus sp. D9 TaxID=665792 RepID=UPI00061F99A6|nr:hypothetical protein [Paenibacillus sp. D9]KKC49524.1 hypothetical protein VE23_24805 [Paenibacillus sp. D9]